VSGQGILVVDDEEKILSAIDRELFFWKTEKDVDLYTAASASSALEILKEKHDAIQVLVSDLKMSAMGGDQLITETKRLYPDIRSILITGYSELGGIARAVSSGISAFIQKPWETKDFIAELEKAMAAYYSAELSRDYLSRVVAQLERTGQIQKRLFQQGELPSARFAVEVSYHPLSEFFCGGDFYQVIPLSDDRCIIILGDVSGHGTEAAFVTGIIRTLISREELGSAENKGFSPADFLGKLNRLILRELAQAPELVITLTAAYLDREASTLVFSNAGNLPVYLVRRDSCDTFAVPGFPCGFTPDAPFTDMSIPIREGDRIVFMTDGLVERGRIAGYIKMDAVRSLLMHFAGDAGFNENLISLLLEMFPGRRFYDDATLVTVSIR
jgi:sigma-B regulation protein RsbU (phosphoserine phosphatase)